MSEAEKLRPATAATITEFREKGDAIVSEATSRAAGIKTTQSMSSDDHRAMIAEGMEHTRRAVESFLTVPSIPLIRDQLNWAVDRLPRDGLPIASLLEGLRTQKAAVADLLSEPAAEEVLPYFDFMISEIERVVDQGER